MKTFIKTLSLILLTLILNNCDTTNPIINENADDSFVVKGSIEDWNYPNDMELILGVYMDNEFYNFESTPITIDGTFNFNFSALDEQDFIPIVEIEDISNNSSLIISNPNAKGILASFYISNQENNIPIEILNHRLDLSGESVNVYQIDFVFCNDKIDITGEIVENNVSKFYNLHFNKGWNKRVVKFINEKEITSVEPVGYKWLLGN